MQAAKSFTQTALAAFTSALRMIWRALHSCLNVLQGDGLEGWQEAAPYNAIHVGASASRIPPALIEQLSPGGRLVLPVGGEGDSQVLKIIDKDLDGRLKEVDSFGVRYVITYSHSSTVSGCKSITYMRSPFLSRTPLWQSLCTFDKIFLSHSNCFYFKHKWQKLTKCYILRS